MKEELQSKLVEILTSIQTATGKASDFALEQLPDIAQSYVTYGRVYLLVMVVFGVVVLGLGAYLCVLGIRAFKRGEAEYRKDHPTNQYRILYRDRYEMGWFQFIGCSLASIIGAAVFLTAFGPAMLVWFAPKVWLLKEIAGLLK